MSAVIMNPVKRSWCLEFPPDGTFTLLHEHDNHLCDLEYEHVQDHRCRCGHTWPCTSSPEADKDNDSGGNPMWLRMGI